MATDTTEYISVLLRNGTDQLDRFDTGPDPDAVKLHDFGIREWLMFAHRFAQKVNYFSTEDDSNPESSWQNFFIGDSEVEDFLSSLEIPNGGLTPHMTLFVCFLKIMGLSGNRLNNVTRRHLDFYYSDILKISKLPATEDKAYILFQLAKNATDYLVKKGTELDGGKDESGKKRVYVTSEELVASKTQVAHIRSVYNEHNILDEPGLTNENRYSITAASVANSSDGSGGELTEDAPTWYPFGYYVSSEEGTSEKTELPQATLGCAIASPVFRLSEGTRRVTVTFTFEQDVTASVAAADLTENFSVYYTAEKDWKGPFNLVAEATDGALTQISGNQLKLTFELDTDQAQVEDYRQTVHGQYYGVNVPVIRFLLDVNNEAGYGIYSEFAGGNLLTDVQADVHVTGMKRVVLESDTAILNERKPFYPFTTQPVKGSSFTVSNEEAFSKKWNNVKIHLDWKNTPESFASWYTAYESSLAENVSIKQYNKFFSGYQFQAVEDIKYIRYGQELSYMAFMPPSDVQYNSIVKNDGYFKIQKKVLYKETWQNTGAAEQLFVKTNDGFESTISVNGTAYEEGKVDAIRLVLQQSFLHELYPRLYAAALSSKTEDALMPNDPYTPFAENLTLEYSATASVTVRTEDEAVFSARDTRLFHEHPFGQNEEHRLLKKKNAGDSLNCHVFPTYCKGGEMYIGLENAANLDLISLYFKVAEGTENPLAKTFVGGQKIEWSILANNVWRSLDSSLMTANETDNLLTSGRIRFTIPGYATTDNTLLEPGFFWVRAKMYKRYDAVCQLHGIHAQAIEAIFDNRGNSSEHLKNGLPKETISKLVQRVSPVKALSQPYASFGGVEVETDELYYRRVSERLRHKNRAITLWDYERLVLQQFPEVYKVKCLNHTDESDFTAPGNVTLVVVPDTVNKTVFDIYQPRVSRGLLNKIAAYTDELNSMHVKLFVINPNYEEVRIEIGAKFHAGLDENNYRKQLEEDLTKFLSPWAFESTKEIAFGISFSRSTLIHYVEQLSYVDYIDQLKIYKNDELQGNHCAPSNPKSILVSAKKHLILPARVTKCDEDNETTPLETCQL